MLDDKMTSLINSFPTLACRNVAHIGQVAEIAQNRSNSSGTVSAAKFIMFVWNGADFDLRHAWGNWDLDHRAAWKVWAADPWWA